MPDRIKNLINEFKIAASILNGTKAFTGPISVQIDLTNKCNNNCIGCWCNSPLLGEKKMSKEEKKKELPFSSLKVLINELHRMNVKEIYLTGGGEPFMHPKIMEIIELIKRKKMCCDMSTNFTLINEKIARELVNLNVDHINISLWAGTAETYSKLHPNKQKKTFYQIERTLKLMAKIKKEKKQIKPVLSIYNVISNQNYKEIKEMVDFAIKTNVNTIDFTMLDPVEGKTECLLLNEKERNILLKEINELENYIDKKNKENKTNLKIIKTDQFLRRVSNKNSLSGLYDTNIVDSMPCYAGWTFSRIMANGNVLSCLKSHKIPIGSIYHNNFKEIWNSEKQQSFRKKSKCKKSDHYFKKINCYKSCDNLGMNLAIHQKLSSPIFNLLTKPILTIIKRLRL